MAREVDEGKGRKRKYICGKGGRWKQSEGDG